MYIPNKASKFNKRSRDAQILKILCRQYINIFGYWRKYWPHITGVYNHFNILKIGFQQMLKIRCRQYINISGNIRKYWPHIIKVYNHFGFLKSGFQFIWIIYNYDTSMYCKYQTKHHNSIEGHDTQMLKIRWIISIF